MPNGLSNFPKVNPFSLSDKEISVHIVASHNPKAEIYEVDHLYNKVSDIIKETNSNQSINKHLELKYGEKKVSHGSNFVPTFHTLKGILSQLQKANKYFDVYTAHETTKQILEKLCNYDWATKGVTTLAAFALNYGEPWHVTKMTPTKRNSLEIHISSSEGLEGPTNAYDCKTLINLAMQLIEATINLNKLIVKNDKLKGTAEDELKKVPQEIYTYWAIITLLACANQITLELKSGLVQRIVTLLSDFSNQWKSRIADVEDYLWRLSVFRSPSGVLELLMALIFPKGFLDPKIYNNTSKSWVSIDQLKMKYLLLLFLTPHDAFYVRNESAINLLQPIHKSFMMDAKKSDFRILCIPLVDTWDEETKETFNELKSMMPWYIVEYFEPIKGYRVFQELWLRKVLYKYLSIAVVDPQGNVLNPDAYDLILQWDAATAFPFTKERENQLTQQYGWLWNLLRWYFPTDEWLSKRWYIFIYGGTDEDQVKELGEFVEKIITEVNLLSKRVEQIKHVNLEEDLGEEFWSKVTTNFQEMILNRKDGDDNVLLEMETLLAMKNEKAWALFSKGPLVLVVDYDIPIFDTLKNFENWKTNIMEQGFDKAFVDYYNMKCSQELERHSYHFQLDNLSFAPQNVACPEPDCRLKMKVKSIEYMCDHEKLSQHLKGTSKKKGDEATL